MSPAKLSEADKNEILQLYRQTEETTSTLSARFGVSSSTISRFLKSQLADGEYENLIQQKRSGRTAERSKEAASEAQQLTISLTAPSLEIIDDLEETIETNKSRRRRSPSATAESIAPSTTRTRRRSSLKSVLADSIEPAIEPEIELKPEIEVSREPLPVSRFERPILKREQPESIEEIAAEIDGVGDISTIDIGEMFGEDITPDDLDDDFEEDEDFDDDEELEMLAYNVLGNQAESLQVLPFDRASVPRTCYLVVDRTAELIARPLSEFGDLGAIPNEDMQAKTLPIFDTHRVARRFSHRTQRVIKVPDAPRLLEKTSSHLQAKGITRLLLDGQVYKI
jgi:transposase-like protein